jgi:hypothetical protein
MSHFDTVAGVERFPTIGRNNEAGINLPWRDTTDRVRTLKIVADMQNEKWDAELKAVSIHKNHRHPGDTLYVRFAFSSNKAAKEFDAVFQK